jgi:hypothetical protein
MRIGHGSRIWLGFFPRLELYFYSSQELEGQFHSKAWHKKKIWITAAIDGLHSIDHNLVFIQLMWKNIFNNKTLKRAVKRLQSDSCSARANYICSLCSRWQRKKHGEQDTQKLNKIKKRKFFMKKKRRNCNFHTASYEKERKKDRSNF